MSHTNLRAPMVTAARQLQAALANEDNVPAAVRFAAADLCGEVLAFDATVTSAQQRAADKYLAQAEADRDRVYGS